MPTCIRSLWDCYHAKYPGEGDYVICDKGHKLGSGYVHKRQVDREDKLVFRVCQLCVDYSPFDTPFMRDKEV